MSPHQVEILVGGSADWGAPVRSDEATLKTQYEAYMMARIAVLDGDTHYLKLRIVGIDEIDADGEVPAGWGALEFQDHDGDWLRGHVDWYRRDGVDGGSWRFTGGTGKWSGADGTIEVVLYGMPLDLDAPRPPVGPSRYFGWLDGSGELSAPALS